MYREWKEWWVYRGPGPPNSFIQLWTLSHIGLNLI